MTSKIILPLGWITCKYFILSSNISLKYLEYNFIEDIMSIKGLSSLTSFFKHSLKSLCSNGGLLTIISNSGSLCFKKSNLGDPTALNPNSLKYFRLLDLLFNKKQSNIILSLGIKWLICAHIFLSV